MCRQWDFLNAGSYGRARNSRRLLALRASTVPRVAARPEPPGRAKALRVRESAQAREANLRLFQVQEGSEGSESGTVAGKAPAQARYFHVKPNAAGEPMIALESSPSKEKTSTTSPILSSNIAKSRYSKIEQYQSEKNLAEVFNPYLDVPKELENDWPGLHGCRRATIFTTASRSMNFSRVNLQKETICDILRDTTLSQDSDL